MNAEAYMMPLTLCSGMIEGAEQWDSYKALRKVMKTGKAEDARAVGAAIVKDMSDPQKARAFTEGIRQAEIGMRAAEILRRDKGELAQMMNDAEKAFRQSKEVRKRKSEAIALWNADYRRHLEAVARICAGADEKALAVIEETSKAIVQYRKDIEKYNQEYEENKAEADRLYQAALNLAQGRAKREMMQEAERTRTRRKKYAEETTQNRAEKNTQNEVKHKPKETELNEMEKTDME